MAEGEPVSLTRGAIWGLADWTDSRTRDQLESIPLAEVPREVPSNAALSSLAQPHDDESIRRLLRVISKVRHRGLRTRAERLLSHAAEPRHETPGSLADRLVPTHGLDSNGARSWVVDGYRVEVRLMPDGESKAAWEPVLDRDTWEIVRAALTWRKAPPGAGRALKYLLSGIARCGACKIYLEQIRQTVAALGHLPEDALTPEAEHVLLDAFRGWRRR